MSTNTESDTDETEQNQNSGGSAVPSYRKEGQADAIDKKRKEAARQEREEKVEKASKSKEARRMVAEEEQPGIDLPQPESKTVEFRGTEFEFAELGDAVLKVARFEDRGENVELLEYIYQLYDEKCLTPGADNAYWAQFDLYNKDDDPDSLMDLFYKLMGNEGVSPEEAEKLEEFRS